MNGLSGDFIDSLKRGYEMEEDMSSMLIELASGSVPENEIPAPVLRKIHAMLESVHKDTIRHAEILGGLIEKARGGRHG